MKNDRKNFEIGILGLWHLGAVYAASFAKLGYRVTGFDLSSKVIDDFNSDNPPIYEPHLVETIRQYLHRNLFFSKNPKDAIHGKKYVFVTLDIPVDKNDRINLKPLEKIFALLIKFCSDGTRIVISSQTPIGTSRLLLNKFTSKNKNIEVIYFPENLRLGQAFETFLTPDRIVLGIEKKKLATDFMHDFPKLKCPLLPMSLESAEMVKHALNTFLAANISFASELGDLCELTGAHMSDVVTALKTDKRISPAAPINPGLGFAGGTLGRDIQTVIKISQKYNYNPKLINAAYQVNRQRLVRLVGKIEKILTTLVGKNIGLLGLTYKPDTDTLRRSHSLELAKLLKGRGAIVKALDPVINNLEKKYRFIKLAKNTDELFKDLDMAILMTDWPQFKKINPRQIANIMSTKIIFDTKGFLQKGIYISAGFKFYTIGRPL